MAVELDIAKQHLRVTHSEEDGVIALYLQAAEESAALFLNRKIYPDLQAFEEGILGGDLTGMLSTGTTDAAILLLLGHLYANREEVTAGVSLAQLPMGFHALLQPFRVGLGV